VIHVGYEALDGNDVDDLRQQFNACEMLSKAMSKTETEVQRSQRGPVE
jgi:hypothetical protein